MRKKNCSKKNKLMLTPIYKLGTCYSKHYWTRCLIHIDFLVQAEICPLILELALPIPGSF